MNTFGCHLVDDSTKDREIDTFIGFEIKQVSDFKKLEVFYQKSKFIELCYK